jgi:hypothetical protein
MNLVDSLIKEGLLKTPRIIEAFKKKLKERIFCQKILKV